MTLSCHWRPQADKQGLELFIFTQSWNFKVCDVKSVKKIINKSVRGVDLFKNMTGSVVNQLTNQK